MYLVLFEGGYRVTTLAIPVHGATYDELEGFANLYYKDHDKAVRMTKEEYEAYLEEESKRKNKSKSDPVWEEVVRVEAEEKELTQAIKELRDEYILAEMQDDEELKASIKEEYMELMKGEEINE